MICHQMLRNAFSMHHKFDRAFFIVLLIAILSACASLPEHEPSPRVTMPSSQPHQGVLRVISLNIAHGRKDAFNQLFLSKEDFEHNLSDIAKLLVSANADIVALQEADGPSRWSGGFDHVATLAEEAGYPWVVHASHAQSWMFDYGTALLSRQAFEETLNHTFKSSPPTMNKGMVLGRIRWQKQGYEGKVQLVDVISVHLDFSRKKVRQRQVKEIADALGERTNPTIILGDFNSDWFAEDSVVQALAERAGLQVYRPDAEDLGTYKDGDKRFDWILITRELKFINYQVLEDQVSDHRAIFAEIGFR
jgi:endonuclease/exonuclease/phosphatase family metal-dependent hydrolase